jgi:hypothetical protein
MFRDESSLSANPHLWSSITDALDQSDWFVLLLSPDAAESEWVNQEVEYWLEHKDSDRTIPVLTDGEFTWSETDIDLESTAVPPALYGAFSDEPRWVDLRFARTEEQLDLNNPRFSAAVADIASAIRRVPKDELESEEVLQHRRTVRTAWAAGAGLLILALIAGGAALFALDQRNDAVANAARADENATEANEQSRLAEENADEANEQRQAAEAAAAEAEEAKQEAEQQAAIAQAREVTLEAEKVLETDPELSSHLAVAALTTLRDAARRTRHKRSPSYEPPSPTIGSHFGCLAGYSLPFTPTVPSWPPGMETGWPCGISRPVRWSSGMGATVWLPAALRSARTAICSR